MLNINDAKCLNGKESICSVEMQETWVWYLGWENLLEGWHGNPLQSFCLENLMDWGSWEVTPHRVSKSWIRLRQLSTQWCKAGKQININNYLQYNKIVILLRSYVPINVYKKFSFINYTIMALLFFNCIYRLSDWTELTDHQNHLLE